jgi:sulfur carrier protein
MRVSVNGQPCDLADGTTVDALVRERGGRERGIAVAVDGEVVPQALWSRTVLGAGQEVELLAALQGG